MSTPPPLRCHLLIGPPGSGKTSLSRDLAPLATGESGEPALVLSTDAIRAELFGDAAVQGPWEEIRSLLLQRLHDSVAAGRPVIIDATHARRPWRLLYTQMVPLPAPVEWIAWWLTTPLPTCLEWAEGRDRPVPQAVIEEFHASIIHPRFKPDRSEGFAAIVTLNPAAGEGTTADLSARLAELDGRIRNALNKDRPKLAQLHRYSRLLDLERLLFLIRLLSSHANLDLDDPGTGAALLQIRNPPPQGDLAERAAAYLASWREVHGGNSDGYGDVEAIRGDLAWLGANGFFSLDWRSNAPITLPPAEHDGNGSVNGGLPMLADPVIFRRVFSLLRSILKEPFDAPDPERPEPGANDLDTSLAPDPEPATGTAAARQNRRARAAAARPKRSPRDSSEYSPLYRHLLGRLCDLEGAYKPSDEAVLRRDLDQILRPYGFLPKVKGRPHSLRQGYAIGTALLSADQLLEVHALLKASLDRLSDQSQKPLLFTLEDRLQRAGLLDPSAGPARSRHPKRGMANRSFTEEKAGTLADPAYSRRLEMAIRDRRRLWLRHLPDVVSEDRRRRGDDGRFRAWPLQLLFHNISWYLAFETWEVGRDLGLIRTLRLDRLVLLSEDGNARRGTEQEHDTAMERLQTLLHVCGGLWFGDSIEAQQSIPYGLLRFSCTREVFRLIREEPRRFPPEHTAYSRLLPSDASWGSSPRDTLHPNPPGDSHPYPVEIRLPQWTLDQDWDLRGWLLRWGADIRIEQPSALQQWRLEQARRLVALG